MIFINHPIKIHNQDINPFLLLFYPIRDVLDLF